MEKITSDYKKELYDFYSASYDSFVKTMQKEQEHLDNWLLKLSSGVFGISFIFINSFCPLKSAHFVFILIISWLLFSFSIILSLIGFRYGVIMNLELQEECWIDYNNIINDTKTENKKSNKTGKKIDLLNSFSQYFFNNKS